MTLDTGAAVLARKITEPIPLIRRLLHQIARSRSPSCLIGKYWHNNRSSGCAYNQRSALLMLPAEVGKLLNTAVRLWELVAMAYRSMLEDRSSQVKEAWLAPSPLYLIWDLARGRESATGQSSGDAARRSRSRRRKHVCCRAKAALCGAEICHPIVDKIQTKDAVLS